MAGTQVKFTTLGTAVIDEIHFPTGTVVHDVLGGSGTFAAFGARLFSSILPSAVGWTIRTGNSFPEGIAAKIRDWNLTLSIIKEPHYSFTRGIVKYEGNDFSVKTFQYSNQVLAIVPDHLIGTPLLASQSFHFLSDPFQMMEHVPRLLALRHGTGLLALPKIVWEPSPSSCVPENLHAFLKAVKLVDVFSPNHLELAAITNTKLNKKCGENDLRKMCSPFESGIGNQGCGAAVVRIGEQGCFIASPLESSKWLPAFHDPRSGRVVDTTGAGNTFVGAFTMGLVDTGSLFQAACYGIVGSSITIEQYGLPSLSMKDGKQVWNGQDVQSRLDAYLQQVRACSHKE